MMPIASIARPPARRFRPRLEALENRDCPSGTDLSAPSLPATQIVPAPGLIAPNPAPSLQMTSIAAGPHEFTLSGHVTDNQPAGLTVQFSGAYSGSAQTDAEGNFSLTVSPDQLGLVSGTVTDTAGLTSNLAQAIFSSMPPMITSFTTSNVLGHIWTFTGHVTDEYAAGLKVTFGGAVQAVDGLTATVDADGNFSLTVEIADGDDGGVSAQTTDWWGLASNQAICWVPPTV